MSVAVLLESALRPLVRGPLPVRLRAWDGSVAGPADAPCVVLDSPRALRRILWHPGELGAAQAYVTGELDVEGDLHEALDRAWRTVADRRIPGVRMRDVMRLAVAVARAGALGGPLPAPATQARLHGRRNGQRRDRAAISHHYDSSNEFYALLLDPAMAYSCAYFTRGVPGLPDEMSRRGRHRGGGAFIESFIAPDMSMRPVGETVGRLEDAGLEVRGVQALREHYVWTAHAWMRRLEEHWDRAQALLGAEGARTWRLYLAGGALAFEQGRMGVDQILARRPAAVREVPDRVPAS